MDPHIVRRGRMDMLELKRYSELKKIVLLGARFAARLEAEGAFDRFDLEPVRLGGQGAAAVDQSTLWREESVLRGR